MPLRIIPTFRSAGIILVPLLAIGLTSCKKESMGDMFKRTGERTAETRELPVFTKIFLTDNINLIIKQGNKQEVKVEAGENLIPLIKTEVISGELHLKNENRCNWARSYKKGVINVYLTLPELNTLWHFGSGKVSSEGTLTCEVLTIQTNESGDVDLTVKANTIYAQMHGTSDITLHGISAMMGVFHIGEGYLHAEDLRTDIAWTHSRASGNEYINAKSALSARIDWAGSVYYSGTPALSSQVNGNGKLIPIY